MNYLELIIEYIRYKAISKSKVGHGIHSPFVYEFVRETLKKNSDNDEELLRISHWAKESRSVILPGNNVRFGSGSKFSKSIFRRFKNAGFIGVSDKFGRFLYNLVRFCKPSRIIELGTGAGISTAYLAAADQQVNVISVEGDPERHKLARSLLKKTGLSNYVLHCKNFDEFLNECSFYDDPVLVFIDGDHNYSSMMRYYRLFADNVGEKSVIVFDDIRWSKDLLNAWKEIIKMPEAYLSIDLFSAGILFFNSDITKQDFIINF